MTKFVLRPHIYWVLLFLAIVTISPTWTKAKTNSNKNSIIEDITDIKGFKKLLRTRTNVLVYFTSSVKEAPAVLKVFREAAEAVRGFGTLVLIDCNVSPERKKLCKKLKVAPEPFVLKHYKDGDFHKDYDRQLTAISLYKFMRDPTGDLPWEENPAGVDVRHFEDYVSLTRHLLKDNRPMMVMFYVPWCAFCKNLKLPYSEAATELKSKGKVLGAMDLERKENAQARRVFNVTAFPTLAYFENGYFKEIYSGDNTKDAIINFMLNPNVEKKKSIIQKETSWSSDANSDVVHLTTEGFDPVIKDEKSVLVMFYAPWCGHCKRLKPEYEKAAAIMKERKIPGVLAAIDTTKESEIGERFEVKGFPTMKYFVDGNYKFDVNHRSAEKLVQFMSDPKEPPPPEKEWEDEEDSEVVFLKEENFSTLLKRKKHAIVMFFAPWCGHCKSTKPEFNSAAKHLKDDTRVLFGAVDCTKQKKICATYDVRSYPTIKYFSYLKIQQPYTGGRTRNDFIEYMTKTVATQNNKEEL